MAMDWKLFDKDGKLIQIVNCQYDSLDISQFSEATKVMVDFTKKETYIIESEKKEQ